MLKLRVKAKRGHDLYDQYQLIKRGHFNELSEVVEIRPGGGGSSEFGSGDTDIPDFSVIFAAKMLEEPSEEFSKKMIEEMQNLFGNKAIIVKEKHKG
ncbi:MAG: hypothetical protein AAGA97_04225 [Pseudomonadota bacterium]